MPSDAKSCRTLLIEKRPAFLNVSISAHGFGSRFIHRGAPQGAPLVYTTFASSSVVETPLKSVLLVELLLLSLELLLLSLELLLLSVGEAGDVPAPLVEPRDEAAAGISG
jgi:hypothetical protein